MIIPARPAEAPLPAALAALAVQDSAAAYEVVVVDDGSRDRTVAIAEAAARSCASCARGRRPAAARNFGAGAARGRVLAFTDADCAPEPGWILAAPAVFEKADLVQAGSCRRWASTSARTTASSPSCRSTGFRRRRTSSCATSRSSALELVRMDPELRGVFLHRRVFPDRRTALLDLALVGAAAAAVTGGRCRSPRRCPTPARPVAPRAGGRARRRSPRCRSRPTSSAPRRSRTAWPAAGPSCCRGPGGSTYTLLRMLGRRRSNAPSTEAQLPAPAPAPAGTAPELPDPPAGARNFVVVVLDSLRYDSWVEAQPRALAELGPVERRYSYATWTAPSHYNLLMGLLPHTSPPEVYASEYYKQDFLRYGERLGVPGVEFKRLLPSIFLPTFLRTKLGYRTHAKVSMPVLNPSTVINRDFDSFELMPKHNDMAAMIDGMRFEEYRPSFHLLNVGETHYPYAVPGEDPGDWPRISGVHGVFKKLDEPDDGHQTTHPTEFFDKTAMRALHDRQIHAVDYLDGVFRRLFDTLPENTWVVVTADHGELFGEDRYFGHGPVMHEKVLEIPFVEGMRP